MNPFELEESEQVVVDKDKSRDTWLLVGGGIVVLPLILIGKAVNSVPFLGDALSLIGLAYLMYNLIPVQRRKANLEIGKKFLKEMGVK